MTTDQENEELKSTGGGNFLSGLLFGAVAGAVGYFLFGTEEGKKARGKLSEEWESAKGKLVEEGVVSQNTITLGETVHEVIHHVIETPKRRMPSRKTVIEKKKELEKKVKEEKS